jgi:hypothetical protein
MYRFAHKLLIGHVLTLLAAEAGRKESGST